MGIRTARRSASSQAGFRRAVMLCCGIAGFAAVASLAACGAGAAPVALPHKASNTPASTATSTPATSAKQAVIDAYTEFWSASSQAEKTGNAAKAEQVLAPYVAPSYISYMITGMQTAWSKGEISWGASVEHIQNVVVSSLTSGAQTAEVQDCQDDSHSGLASAKTGALVPGTLGSADQELYASLSLVNGHWLIEQVTFVGDTCTG